MGKRIVIMAGGTGGHVFPALAVADFMREKGWRVSWIGTHNGLEHRVVPANGIEIDWLTVAGLRGKGVLAKLQAPLMLLKACLQAADILRRRQPDVVLGMGGFVAGPGGLMAKLLTIPLVIHEQNRVPGTTNRLLSRVANQVLEAFPGSFKKQGLAHFTGNPLRKEFNKISQNSRFSSGQTLHLLVMGGSQGAKALNELVPEAVALLDSVEVRHQTGKAMREQVSGRYAALGITAEVDEFFENMTAAYQWADMVICRAGAMTISELAICGLPSLLIPFPYAIDDHQTANARYLCDAGGAKLVQQKNLSVKVVVNEVRLIQKNLRTMGLAAKACAKPEATENVAAICMAQAGA